MNTLKMFLGLGAVVALMGFNVANAEIQGGTGSLTFSVDTGDGTNIDVSFAGTSGGDGGEESQATCAMTPGGESINAILEEPFPIPAYEDPIREVARAADVIDPVQALQTPPAADTPITNIPNSPTWYPPPDGEEPPPLVVPEPATLLMVGLGIGAAVVARRRLVRRR